ncbi:MAG TPA: RdgB/HAM1 family non-canonical purine NTP pyrophosphatase [Chthoniobacterales bacterium]|nr:RdgB/HAM1 family non-canonical purine NTP pyrophosphatase [Chthoniobacterales bacterium]
MKLLLATRNPHKTREFRELLLDQFEIADLGSYPKVKLAEETGTTFEQNATLKAVGVSTAVDGLVIADDSGLEVDALNGAPGIYSARYGGVKTSDAANIAKLLRELGNAPNRSARFRCVIALARAGKALGTLEGVVEGRILDQPRGKGGFGYDPVFQPTGFEETFAEMVPQLKNRISHRAKAVAALLEKLREIRD